MNQENKDEVVYLYLDDIIPNRFQPREVFDERALKELAVSIKEHGVIQPIIVRNVNGKYEIIAGERRYKASALAGLTKIPAIIRELDDKESSKVALLENLQRKNLNAIEEARTYQKILELDQMTQEELAKTMGKSQSAVANKIRLLSLSDEIQDAVLKEKISERHARALLNIPDNKKQKEMLKKVISERLTVRKLEELIKQMYPAAEKKGIDDIVSMNNNINVPTSEKIASTTDFVNNNPLMPTTEMPKEQSDYGKVKIVPPEGEQMENTPKFINYGEIDNDEETKTEQMDFVKTTSPNVEDIKSSSADINTNNNNTSLDSLLNIPNVKTETTNKFITPAEGIVKTDLEGELEQKNEDYFKTPDLISVDLPDEVQTKNDNNIPLGDSGNNDLITFNSDSIKDPDVSDYKENHQFSSTNMNLKQAKDINKTLFLDSKIESSQNLNTDTYSIQDCLEKVRSLVKELNAHNVKVDIEEMNLNKSYQIIIKLDKTDIE